MAVVRIFVSLRMLGNKTWRMQSKVRTFTSTPRVMSNHYDVLGITPKATQSDIKSAYYKLSKMYHPDISNDEASAKKFRSISEAYEVLGNVRLKKMYDKGLIVGQENNTRMDYQPEPEPTDPTVKFYKSRTSRHVATMDGRTPIFNFDAWSKEHYGNLFTKAQYEKDFIQRKKAKQTASVNASKQEALIYLVVALGALFVMLVVQGKEDYDKDSLTALRNRKNPEDKVVDQK